MLTHRGRSFTRSAAALSLILLSVALTSGCNKIKSKQEIKKGNDFFKAAQYQTALAAYQEALRLDPNEKKLHKNIGLAYMGLYQPGSKHPKDLEYAAKAIEHRGVRPSGRAQAVGPSSCTATRSVGSSHSATF